MNVSVVSIHPCRKKTAVLDDTHEARSNSQMVKDHSRSLTVSKSTSFVLKVLTALADELAWRFYMALYPRQNSSFGLQH